MTEATARYSEAFTVGEHEIYVKEPEALNVGQLNRVVRELREALYQQKLMTQTGMAAAAIAPQGEWILPCPEFLQCKSPDDPKHLFYDVLCSRCGQHVDRHSVAPSPAVAPEPVPGAQP